MDKRKYLSIIICVVLVVLLLLMLILFGSNKIPSPMAVDDTSSDTDSSVEEVLESSNSSTESEHEKLSSQPTETTTAETAPPTKTSDESIAALTDGMGNNNQTHSAKLRTGETLNVGISAGENSDYIFLSPILTDTKENVNYVFYLKSTRDAVEYEMPKSEAGEVEKWPDCHQFFAYGETFDTLIPNYGYRSESEFGCRWKHDISYDGSMREDSNTTIYLHITDEDTHRVLGAFKIEIVYDAVKSHYKIGSLDSTDVRDTGELSEDDQKKILDITENYLIGQHSNEAVFFAGDEEYVKGSRETAVISHLLWPYFLPIHDIAGLWRLYPSNYYGFLDIYAVNIQYEPHDSVTFYFAPSNQLIGKGFDRPYAPGSTDLDLRCFGFSAIDTETIESYNEIQNRVWGEQP